MSIRMNIVCLAKIMNTFTLCKLIRPRPYKMLNVCDQNDSVFCSSAFFCSASVWWARKKCGKMYRILIRLQCFQSFFFRAPTMILCAFGVSIRVVVMRFIFHLVFFFFFCECIALHSEMVAILSVYEQNTVRLLVSPITVRLFHIHTINFSCWSYAYNFIVCCYCHCLPAFLYIYRVCVCFFSSSHLVYALAKLWISFSSGKKRYEMSTQHKHRQHNHNNQLHEVIK